MARDLDPSLRIRPATKDDIDGMVEVFFRSFNAPYWRHLCPDTADMRQWWHEAWTLSLENPQDRCFVAEDTKADNKIVAFSRWMVPQPTGTADRPWPELGGPDWDMDLAGAFFGGMEENHHELMHGKPHWFLELLGVHEDYQRRGIADALVRWGLQQADEGGLQTYLDASAMALPWYKRYYGFREAKVVPIPDRPSYGSYAYTSIIRDPQQDGKH